MPGKIKPTQSEALTMIAAKFWEMTPQSVLRQAKGILN